MPSLFSDVICQLLMIYKFLSSPAPFQLHLFGKTSSIEVLTAISKSGKRSSSFVKTLARHALKTFTLLLLSLLFLPIFSNQGLFFKLDLVLPYLKSTFR